MNEFLASLNWWAAINAVVGVYFMVKYNLLVAVLKKREATKGEAADFLMTEATKKSNGKLKQAYFKGKLDGLHLYGNLVIKGDKSDYKEGNDL